MGDPGDSIGLTAGDGTMNGENLEKGAVSESLSVTNPENLKEFRPDGSEKNEEESVLEEDDEDDDDDEQGSPLSPRKGSHEEAVLAVKLAKQEERQRRQAKRLHDAKLKEIREKQNEALARDKQTSAEARIQFLIEQADVFGRFMEKGVDELKSKSKSKGSASASKGRGRGRKTEEEEDEELMNAQMHGKVLTRLMGQPSCITGGKMRPYQVEGLNFLIGCYEQGINAILADEMGLGKTLQTISLLGYLKNDRKVSGPHIIIVPKSVLGNWIRELNRWCPSLRTIRVHGTQAERADQIQNDMIAGEFDVCCTTYEVVRIERAAFLKFKWRYLIMDEAHSIKNDQSRLAQRVRELSTEFRMLITGTPLQNNLRELWALLNFLLPEVFGNAQDFEDFFQIDQMAEQSVVSKLHAILRPFMIRRLKSDVEGALLPKREIKLFTGMSEMQTYYYKNTLSRDVAALNQLGGPDKTRLMNILMQLRKVCNHPYLFQGAEPGPPYFDGPHLWENSGKMILLDKLLAKLKQNGDRVLIFSQMTRLLDILEDYMRCKGYEYSRIDGNTNGEDRDKYMEEFNAPGSSKFVFLLSTRAGGLGINLQTANIVILYDSDWNPQMDLQAQDRAHRIGQKKRVTVFRLITEGTVEEKIVERAEKKLYLDAVVVQQGRLQEANKNLNKVELMSLVKFGAEAIFKTGGVTVTDEDIDAILARGEKITDETSKKFQLDAQHNLLNFSIIDDKDTFEFEGENYRNKALGNFIALPQRSRKKNYDVNEYYRQAMDNSKETAPSKEKRMPRGLTMYDFQFYQKDSIEAIERKENELLASRRAIQQRIREAKQREKRTARPGFGEEEAENEDNGDAVTTNGKLESETLKEELDQYVLSEEDAAEKERLVSEGFGTWNRRDFRNYTLACERHGREAKEEILNDVAESTGKSKSDIRKYHTVFWKRYTEIADWERILDRIKRGEQKLARRAAITTALDKKVNRTKNAWQSLTINYGSNKGKTFTEEEDRFLVCMMQRLGYGAWDQLKQEIRKAWNFRFDWFLKSRTALELQRRCDTLVRLIEKENDDEDRSSSSKRKSTSGAKGDDDSTSQASAKKSRKKK